MRQATDQQIAIALSSGNMTESSIAKRAGISRQHVRNIARNKLGITAAAAKAAWEARQDKIWEEIKKRYFIAYDKEMQEYILSKGSAPISAYETREEAEKAKERLERKKP